MKLLDGIMRQPAAVAFGMRRGGSGSGSFTVARDGDSISLISGIGAATELPAASGADAGVLSAADKAALDGLRLGQTGAAQFASRSEARGSAIQPAVTALRTGGYAAAGDGGGAAYTRVASEPAHELKLQSADGAWWELLPDPGGLLLEQCGATGDGAADDTAAFEAWRGYVVARLGDGVQGPEHLVTLRLGRGRHYTYTNNRWVYGIPRLRIEGNGARLECIADEPLGENARALNQKSWFYNTGYARATGTVADRTFGHLIATSLAGQPVVGFVTAAEAADYAAGDVVLIGGLPNIAGDFPVDYRYFEIREVASVDAAAGTLTLTEDLANSYHATWPVIYTDNGFDLGPARILKLNRPQHLLTRYFELNDVTLVPNRVRPGLARAVFDSALHIVLNRVDTRGLLNTAFSGAHRIECRSCRFGEVEGDKLVDQIVFEDCEINGGIGQFVGTHQIEITRGVIRGGTWKVGAKHQTVRGAYLDNMVLSVGSKIALKLNYDEARRIETQVFENLRVSDPSLQLIDAAFNDVFQPVTFDALGAAGELLIPKPITKAAWYTYNSIEAGARMVSGDGASLCEVTDFVDYDAGNLAIRVDWLSPVPAGPVTLYHATARTLKVVGGNASSAWGMEDRTIRLRWTDRDPFWRSSAQDAFVLGAVRAVRVNVLRAASSAAAHKLWFRDVQLARNLIEVDLKTAGLREITPNGIAGQAGADVFTAANWTFIETLRIEPRLGGGGGLPATAPERARFAVEALIDTVL